MTPSSPERRQKLGEIEELKEQIRQLKYEIHARVGGIMQCFDPYDNEMDYIDRIDTGRLSSYAKKIAQLKPQIDTMRKRIEAIKANIGSEVMVD